jgi:RimJ/RimL family protein N-acetyltransferase
MADTPPILIDLPDQLVGNRVVVRPWDEADARELWEAVDASREHLEPWMPWVEAYHNPDAAMEYIRRSAGRWMLREELAVAIVETATGRVLGSSGLHRINWTIKSC